MKILISGGHLTPALSFIDYVQAHHHDEIVFVGRKYSQLKTQQLSQEQAEIEKRGVRFIVFHTGKMSQFHPVEFIQQVYTFGRSLSVAHSIITREKPSLFLSFGGYLAVPLALSCFLQHIPIVTHEQTRSAGLANRLIGLLANKVAVSYPESARFFTQSKVVVTGNPLRAHLFARKVHQPDWLPEHPALPILYVTGGNQGSLFINHLIADCLPELTKQWLVIHQCGPSTKEMNYAQLLEDAKHHLPAHQQSHYVFREWLSEQDLAWVYRWAAAIVGRAGANTVQEVRRVGKPAIFIPLPNTHDGEQLLNAQVLEQAGSALVYEQATLNIERFLEGLVVLKKRYHTMLQKARELQSTAQVDAEQQLYDLISHTLQPPLSS